MHSKIKLELNNTNYDLTTGFDVYEKLGEKDNDKYQYVFPSYDFSRNINFENLDGTVNFYSSGSNSLKNTNNLTTSITNDLSYNSK